MSGQKVIQTEDGPVYGYEITTDDIAIDWLMAVRRFGLDEANRLFADVS